MKKVEFKSIIKECLLEILAEGLGNSLDETFVRKQKIEKINERKKDIDRMQERKRSVADTVSYATSDPVMGEILRHTAQTTFVEQSNNEIVRDPRMLMAQDGMPQVGSSGPGIDIDGMFSEVWAEAAFSQKKVG